MIIKYLKYLYNSIFWAGAAPIKVENLFLQSGVIKIIDTTQRIDTIKMESASMLCTADGAKLFVGNLIKPDGVFVLGDIICDNTSSAEV